MSLVPSQSTARVYAEALFELARADDRVEPVLRESESVRRILAAQPAFGDLLAAPVLRPAAKIDLLQRVFGGRLSLLMMNFLGVVAAKGRLGLLETIGREFLALADAHAGRVEGTVVTAVPLDEQEQSRLAEQLSRALRKSVRLRHRVDPTILGGMVLTVGDQLWDSSVRAGLEQFRRRLRRTATLDNKVAS